MNLNYLILIITGFILISLSSKAQTISNQVKISGAMKNVMKRGELQGTISLDTILNKSNLYGLGPKEYLKGELLVMDGTSYVSTVNVDGSINVIKDFNVKAPFFVYTNATNFKEYILPENIRTLKQLETYIDTLTENNKRPFNAHLFLSYQGLFQK